MSFTNYNELFYGAIIVFKENFGEEKFIKIFNKIQTSNKISDLIRVSHQNLIVPNKNDYLYSLNEVPYFIFAGTDTLAIGAVLALNRWNEECNRYLHLADEAMLNYTLEGILKDCYYR